MRSVNARSMVPWGFMILEPLAEFWELNSSGGGSSNQKLPGLSFGNKNMPRIGRRRITLECQGILRAPTFGTLPGKIKILFSKIVSGRFELGT